MKSRTFYLFSIMLHLLLVSVLIDYQFTPKIVIIKKVIPVIITPFPQKIPPRNTPALIIPEFLLKKQAGKPALKAAEPGKKIPLIIKKFSIGSSSRGNNPENRNKPNLKKSISGQKRTNLTDKSTSQGTENKNIQHKTSKTPDTGLSKIESSPDNKKPGKVLKMELESNPKTRLYLSQAMLDNIFAKIDRKKALEYSSYKKSKQFSRAGFRSGRDEEGYGDGITATAGSAVFNSQGYDITPWARRVVYRIKKNWILPASVQFGIKGIVGIYSVINKNGTVGKIIIKRSSKVTAFDRAAYAAISISTPFPPLPEDFPYKNLEGYILFKYN